MLNVIFAPDYRAGVPYQELLATALQGQAVNVDFLAGYKRVFPLRRLLAGKQCDLLHLHWPEAYYPNRKDAFDWVRFARFPFDLKGTIKRCVLATTAHNFYPHGRAEEPFAKRNVCCVHTNAHVVFAHSAMAKQRLVESFDLPVEKVRVIPHGDLSVAIGAPLAAPEARRNLGVDSRKIALMFGTVDPYKGLEEVIAWWHQRPQSDVRLAIVGKPCTPQYGARIVDRIGVSRNILHRLGWLPDDLLKLWLSAANVVIFNYCAIFTSGAASLARSYGVPILLPKRLNTVDLDEPTPYVRRFTEFETDFEEELAEVLNVAPDYRAASPWRVSCSWDRVADLTIEGYRYAADGML